MSGNEKNDRGKVCLVGAGPGDPGLITVTGLARLRSCDVVVFDALANAALLDEAPAAAERIDVGKRANFHKLTQDETNQLLADLAADGKHVVRLKGGDPYLYGRGAEECAFLARRGIPCEVIPGVTSGFAAPATAGIPVTHRKVASTVTVVTGHEDPTKAETSVDYDGLARLIGRGGTACFYMGVGRLQAIADALTAAGLPPDAPAAVVQWGTLPTQRTARGTLADIAEEVKRSGVSSPAIIVVGKVAALDEPGLDFFTARPLFGQRVLVTRTRHQASELREALAELGAEVIEAPTLELEPPEDWTAIDDVLADAATRFDWLMLTSVNAVQAVAERLDFLGLDTRVFGGVSVASVGSATTAALWERLRLLPDFVPGVSSGDGLADEITQTCDLTDKRCLLLRADLARPGLPRRLADHGAEVTELVAYRTRRPASLPDHVLDAVRDGLDWATFTSSSTVTNLLELLGDDAARLADVRLGSIGPLTSDALRAAGLTPTVVAARPGVAELADAVAAYHRSPGAPA
ncbi:MAG: uroporphyrinogen-III C-methyltransferase [Planctomycetota bacterium]